MKIDFGGDNLQAIYSIAVFVSEQSRGRRMLQHEDWGYRRLKNSLMRVRKRIEAKERQENLRASLKVLRRKEEPESGLIDGNYPPPRPMKCLMTGPDTVRYMNSFTQGSKTFYLLKGKG